MRDFIAQHPLLVSLLVVLVIGLLAQLILQQLIHAFLAIFLAAFIITGLSAFGVSPRDLWQGITGTAKEAKHKTCSSGELRELKRKLRGQQSKRDLERLQRKLCGKGRRP